MFVDRHTLLLSGTFLCYNKIVVRVDVRFSERTHVKNTGDMSSIYHDMIDVYVNFSIRKQLLGLMNFLVMESSTTDNHISSPGEVDQLQPIWRSFAMEAEFSNGYAKDTVFAHPGLKIGNGNFGIVAGAVIISALKTHIKSIFGHIVRAWAQINVMLKNFASMGIVARRSSTEMNAEN